MTSLTFFSRSSTKGVCNWRAQVWALVTIHKEKSFIIAVIQRRATFIKPRQPDTASNGPSELMCVSIGDRVQVALVDVRLLHRAGASKGLRAFAATLSPILFSVPLLYHSVLSCQIIFKRRFRARFLIAVKPCFTWFPARRLSALRLFRQG